LPTSYNHLLKLGGVLNVKIDQELKNSTRKASSMYRREQRKKQDMEKERQKESMPKYENEG